MSERVKRIEQALKEGKIVVIAMNVKRFQPEKQPQVHFEEVTSP